MLPRQIYSVCVSSKAVASGSNVEGRSNKRTRRRDNHSRGLRVTIVDSGNMCANELGAKDWGVKDLGAKDLDK